MYTKSRIRNWSSGNTYSKGLDIFNSGKVRKLEVDQEGEMIDLSARVKSSGRSLYDVRLEYNEDSDSLESSYCDCPAFYTYSGLCKHCVAVLLEYLDSEQNSTDMEDDWNKTVKNLSELLGIKPGMPSKSKNRRHTTPQMKQLLQQKITNKTALLTQDDTLEKVSLEPHLTNGGTGLFLSLRIGRTKKYILKDIFAFVSHMENGEHYSYGKSLEFVHTLTAFTPESQQLVEFIRSWVVRHRSEYMQTRYYGYSYASTVQKLRDMPLQSSEIEEFFEIVKTQGFWGDLDYRAERIWHIADGEVIRRMKIQGQEDGISLSINVLTGIQGVKYWFYYLDGEVVRVPRDSFLPILDFLKCMAEIPDRRMFIDKSDVPAFCRELLPTLEKYFVCEKQDFDELSYGVLPVTFQIYLDSPQKDWVEAKLFALYGDQKYEVFVSDVNAGSRDIEREAEVSKVVRSYFNAYDEKQHSMNLTGDDEKLYELLVFGIPRMQQLGEVFVSDRLKRINVTAAPKVTIGVSLSGNLMELKMTAGDMPMQQLQEILSKYNRKKKFYRLKNGDFINVEDEGFEALVELKQGLNLTDSQLKKEKIKLPTFRAMYVDSTLKDWQSLAVNKDKSFKALIRNMKTVDDNDFEIPQEMETILREYQKRGFLWIKTLQNNGFGGILADDMGLGKTLQVICFLLSKYQETPQEKRKNDLILSPASLVYNWKNELEKFAPALPVKMITGNAAERKAAIEQRQPGDILLTSYDLLKRDLGCYEGITFDCEVIDEAQYIKNHNTQAARAVKAIDVEFRLALTGTPVENRLSELWSIFDYLMPGFLYTYPKFKTEIEAPIAQHNEEYAIKRLQKMIKPFVLRRIKKEVLTDLPDKLEENVYAKLEGEQQQFYDAHVKRLQMMLDKQSDEEFKKSKIQILSELTKLRQVCCDPSLLYEDYQGNSTKLEMCVNLIQNAVSGDHKILLFSQFTTMLEHIQEKLTENGISFYTLTGATSKEKRAELVENFNNDDTSVFCISLKAGGTGLNLTAADIVIHYDPWWNLAVQNQATDRAHRIGQKNVVNVYRLIVKGTIEENIVKLQEKKMEMADRILNGEGMNAGSFTKEELMELFS